MFTVTEYAALKRILHKDRMPLSSAEISEDPSISSVDPDQTASIGAVWSGSTLYASKSMLKGTY